MSISAAEFRTLQPASNKRVRNARRTPVNGIPFDSKREALRYLLLLEGVATGQIRDLRRQVKIPLLGRNGPILTPTGRLAHYVADFQYYDVRTGQYVLEDAKGYPTEIYTLKRAILAAQGITIKEV